MKRCKSPLCTYLVANELTYCTSECKDDAYRFKREENKLKGIKRKTKPSRRYYKLNTNILPPHLDTTQKTCRWCPIKIPYGKKYNNTHYCSHKCREEFLTMWEKQKDCLEYYRWLNNPLSYPQI